MIHSTLPRQFVHTLKFELWKIYDCSVETSVWHCEFGPARIAVWPTEKSDFWLGDVQMKLDQWLQKTPLSNNDKLQLILKYS